LGLVRTKEIDTFIQQGRIKLIKIDRKDITKDFYLEAI